MKMGHFNVMHAMMEHTMILIVIHVKFAKLDALNVKPMMSAQPVKKIIIW